MKLLAIPRPWLYAGIMVFATLGCYTLNNNVTDLIVLWVIGLIGFGMRVLDVPVAPCVVGLILGPLAEQQFRRALAISEGDASVFFTHPISLALLSSLSSSCCCRSSCAAAGQPTRTCPPAHPPSPSDLSAST